MDGAGQAASRNGARHLPSIVRTPLKDHQRESFAWQVDAWKAGLPGILNADEQGLGKTLQTIAFLAWLKQHAADPRATHRGPVLVVAPTSLLENWEQEVAGIPRSRASGTSSASTALGSVRESGPTRPGATSRPERVSSISPSCTKPWMRDEPTATGSLRPIRR